MASRVDVVEVMRREAMARRRNANRERARGNESKAQQFDTRADLVTAGKDAVEELIAAAKDQHRAIDWLMARLIATDPEFMPSQSPIWGAVVRGKSAIELAGKEGE